MLANTTNEDPREQRGWTIATKSENQITRVSENEYLVNSQREAGKQYQVIATTHGWGCSCPDYVFRSWTCKHIHAVKISNKLRVEVQAKRSLVLEPVSVSQCQFCGSSKLRKFGIRHNKAGDIQRFLCEYCKRTFSVNLAFEKMKHNPQAVTSAMQLYFSGESLRNTQKSLRLLGVQVSYQTVWNWIQKYVSLMKDYAEKIAPQVSNTWRADEVYVKISGDQKYLFALMDDETRYWIAQEVADTKDKHDARGLFAHGKKIAGKTPRTIITDGLRAYHQAYLKEYRTQKNDTKHIAEIALAGKVHNNKMERLNGEFRDREKVMRGLKTKESPILPGVQIFHNFIREHEGLDGKTPSQACGIEIKGENKWKTLIENAKVNENKNTKSGLDDFV